jgi:hypothetical protein
MILEHYLKMSQVLRNLFNNVINHTKDNNIITVDIAKQEFQFLKRNERKYGNVTVRYNIRPDGMKAQALVLPLQVLFLKPAIYALALIRIMVLIHFGFQLKCKGDSS